jgi:hypothetical protein
MKAVDHSLRMKILYVSERFSPHFSPGVILWAAGGVIKPVRLLLS